MRREEYVTLEGRTLVLENLPSEWWALWDKVNELARERRPWYVVGNCYTTVGSALWVDNMSGKKIVRTPLYAALQDVVSRLGIEQGAMVEGYVTITQYARQKGCTRQA